MNDTYLTRQTLLKRLKSMNDELAWEEFLTYYKGFIYSIVQKMGIGTDDCEDIVQSVLLKIWKSLGQFDYKQNQGHFRRWLHTITRNTVLNHITKSNRSQSRLDFIKVDGEGQYNFTEIDKIIQKEWELHISTLAFKAVKERVSSQAMDAFLAAVDNEPVNKTAERLKVTEDMVYTYRSRVKMKLMAEMKNLREMLE